MNKLLQTELVRTLRWNTPRENLEQMIVDHAPVNGHCRCCRTVSPCSLYTAATKARRAYEDAPA
jgi:hypothetical protein